MSSSEETNNLVEFMMNLATDPDMQETMGCGSEAALAQLFSEHGVAATDGQMLVDAIRDPNSSADFSQNLLDLLARLADFLKIVLHETIFITTCYATDEDDNGV